MKLSVVLFLFSITVGNSAAAIITENEFKKGATLNEYPSPTTAQYKSLVNHIKKSGITTKKEAAMALAQFLHESDGLGAKREYACAETGCPGQYATPGCDVAGKHYYGRGYVQLFWCYNYRAASQDLYGNGKLVQTPDLVARKEKVAWETAFWFWKKNVHPKDGVAQGKFGVTTKAINGDLECNSQKPEGYKYAKSRFAKYKKVSQLLDWPATVTKLDAIIKYYFRFVR